MPHYPEQEQTDPLHGPRKVRESIAAKAKELRALRVDANGVPLPKGARTSVVDFAATVLADDDHTPDAA